VNQCDPTYSSKRNKRKAADPVDEEFINFLKKPNEEIQDSFYHFGMSVAADLRQMDDGMAAYAKMRISQIIYEAKYPQPPQNYGTTQ
jgi:hypothetical protein